MSHLRFFSLSRISVILQEGSFERVGLLLLLLSCVAGVAIINA